MKSNFPIILSSCLVILLVSLITFPFTHKKEPVGELSYAVTTNNLSGEIQNESTNGYFEGQEIPVPGYILQDTKLAVLGASNENRWVEVDLSEQRLRAWEGDAIFMETPVSTGLSWWPTPQGEFRIWIKLRATRMTGGSGKYAYDLPNVPYTMFFENENVPSWRGYGLHGAYWHNQFGTPRSHGCVNLPVESAKQLYYWVSPELPEGKSSIKATEENRGTRVVIHE